MNILIMYMRRSLFLLTNMYVVISDYKNLIYNEK